MLRAVLVIVHVLALLVALAPRAQAQPRPPTTSSVPDKDKDKDREDDEADDSPRASMRAFLELGEHHRWQEASRYLDLPRGSEKRGADLAAKLYVILAQKLLVIPESLSPLARGRPTDGLPAGSEELGKIEDAKGHAIPIRLVRHEAKTPDDEPRWVFSQSTVSHVDALYVTLGDRWIREHLPPSLLLPGPLALYRWQWLAVPILAAICLTIGRILSYISGLFTRGIFLKRTWGERFLGGMTAPTTLGWGLAAFWALTPYLALTVRAQDLVERGLRALAYLAFFWALLRIVTVLGDQIARGKWAEEHPGSRAVTSVGTRFGKLSVAVFALTVALTELGFPVASVVAGLGIGGVVLALAAQKTVENLFGSIAILVDRPFDVGDLIRVETVEGRVETIGLRSTRVRTADRSLVVFPNGKLADTRIESLESREWIRFTTRLPVSRTATPEQLKTLVTSLFEKLDRHEKVRKEDLMVRLTAIGEGSYDVDVAAHVDTRLFVEFVRVREELLFACFESVEKAGTRLAVPTRELLGGSPGTA